MDDLRPSSLNNLEEEIKALFDLSHPQNWRHSIISPDLEGFETLNLSQSPNEENKLALKTFWTNIHLGCYGQLDFDLKLTLTDWSRNVRPMGGLLYNVQNFKTTNEPIPNAPEDIDNTNLQQEEEESFLNFHSSPPNDLHLANILRIAIDCPFPEVRKQATRILELIHVI